MTLLMLLMAVSATIVSATNRNSNAILLDELEKNEKTNNANITGFYSFFGVMIADIVITESERHPGGYIYNCTPVEKVTVIGFGSYYNLNDPEANNRFYMKSFTNVSELLFISSTKYDVSDEYQHISLFVTRRTPCMLIFNL